MIVFKLDGTEINAPEGLFDFTLSLDDNGQMTLSQDTVILSNDGNNFVRQWIEDGKLTQELPFDVFISGHHVFRGYIDLQENPRFYGDRQTEVKIVSYDSFSWVENYGNSVSFGVLELRGFINDSSYKRVNYQVNFRPDSATSVTTILALYTVTKTLIETIKDIGENAIDVTPQVDPLGYAKAVAKVVVRIAGVVAQIIALGILVKNLVEALLPQKGSFKCMRIVDMFSAIASYFGLTFDSSIFTGELIDLVYIPKKSQTLPDKGIPDLSSQHYNVGDFISSMKQLFNADLKVYNGVMRFERWDNFKINNSQILKSNFSDPERMLNSYTFNTDEIVGNYNITYQYDTTELNTLDGDGLSFQESIENVRGLAQVTIPFAMAKRKEVKGDVEIGLDGVIGVSNSVTGVFGGNRNTTSNSKMGAMLISNKEFTVDKIALLRGGNIKELPAQFWWDNFHFVNSFTVNQWKVFDSTSMEMSLDDYRAIINSNIIVDDNGQEARIDAITFNPSTNKAEVTYRQKYIYAKGLNAEFI